MVCRGRSAKASNKRSSPVSYTNSGRNGSRDHADASRALFLGIQVPPSDLEELSADEHGPTNQHLSLGCIVLRYAA